MPRKKNAFPNYLHHKPTDTARCYIYDGGRRRLVSLGKYNSPESRAAYRSLLAELEKQQAAAAAPAKPITRKRLAQGDHLAALCCAFLDHAGTYYVGPAGKRTSEYHLYSSAIAVLLVTPVDAIPLAEWPAAEFGLRHLDAVRAAMLDRGWTRGTINGQITRIRGVMRWGEERGLMPEGTWHRLQALTQLKKGRTPAPEDADIEPIADEIVNATTPHMTPTVAAMVRFQRLTACRPQDVCNLAWEHIDRRGEVWTFTPPHHKTAHHGKTRVVRIGPAAQAVLTARGLKESGFVFSPSESKAEWLVKRRAGRKTKLWQSHVEHQEQKRALAPKRRPGRCWTTSSYAQSIEYACKRGKIPCWSPNRLRHTALTEYRELYGLEVARIIAGHADGQTTTIYAKQSDHEAVAAVKAKG